MGNLMDKKCYINVVEETYNTLENMVGISSKGKQYGAFNKVKITNSNFGRQREHDTIHLLPRQFRIGQASFGFSQGSRK